MEILKFKPDGKLRRQFYHSTSLSHPAKAHLGMMLEIISRYTKEGETILDPMAGIGGTMIAALMGRSVILVELEQHFIEPMRASWEKMRQNLMLGYELGQVVILRGDARALPLGEVDSIVTSPPYEGSITSGSDGIDWSKARDMDRSASISRVESGSGRARGYSRPVDAAIFSPPYEQEHQGGPDTRPEAQQGGMAGRTSERYTRPQVDAVITSPPYGDTRCDGGGQLALEVDGGFKPYTEVESRSLWHTQRDQTNIGNLRGPAYWDAMRQVYIECGRVLRPGGLMVLVLKGFTRDGKYIDLPAQTQVLCETLGFNFVEQWQRELWNLSFWRILQKRRDPAAWDDRLRFENVLVLQREGQ